MTKEKTKFTVLVSRVDPSAVPGIQKILESYHAWNGGGYAFISPEEANAMVERKELAPRIDHWENGGQRVVYGLYQTWSFICKTDRATRESQFGFATVTQRMCDMLEAYQAAWSTMGKAVKKAMYHLSPTGTEVIKTPKPRKQRTPPPVEEGWTRFTKGKKAERTLAGKPEARRAR